MPSTPPRRSRRSVKNDRGLPVVPLLIAVVVLGFAIGAGLSLVSRNSARTLETPVSVAPAEPTLARVTPAPTERPTREPTEAPTEVPSIAPTRAAAVTPTPTAIVSQRPARAAASAAAAAVVSSGLAAATATAPASPAASPSATAADVATALPSATPVAPLAATATATANAGAFSALAVAVVRQYLGAVERGEPTAAYAALGAAPGDKHVALKEAGIVDPATRIGRIDAQPSAGGDVFLTVPLRTASGPYVATYTVRRSESGAAIIVDHAISKG